MIMEWKYAAAHWILSVLYVIPVILCWYWRVRRQTFSQSHVSTFWRLVFITMLFIGASSRAVFWFIQPFYMSEMIVINSKVNAYWAVLPGLFIFTDYLVILFLWIQIYHSDEETTLDIKPYFIYIASLVYGVALSLMIADFIIYPVSPFQPVPKFDTTLSRTLILFVATVYLLASIGYIFYGIRFYRRLANRPLLYKNNILPRVLAVTALCGICFVVRAVLVLLDSFFGVFTADSESEMEFYWWFDMAYYIPLEIGPLMLMLKLFTPPQTQVTEITEISLEERRSRERVSRKVGVGN